MTTRSIPNQIGDLDELVKHKGWRLLTERMSAEIAVVTRRLTDNPSLPEDQLHYYRGLLAAANSFLRVPERLRVDLENELLLQNAKAATAAKAKPPATAG